MFPTLPVERWQRREGSCWVKEIHANSGFELCQFLFSSPVVETALGPPEHEKCVRWGESEQKILGMYWQAATDYFKTNVKYHRTPSSVVYGERVPTKRQFLSLVMSTFDPLGFLCCLIITAVYHFHAKMKHQNVEMCVCVCVEITEIRMIFWVTKLRRVLRKVISACNVCKLQRARPVPPVMGPLPEDRLEVNGWPFKTTGLVYFGPLMVTVARHKEKRWVAMFTCLTTRAIHLELAHDLSTDSCIIAIMNFVCRRGPVHKLRSDNGKTFVEADREARRFGDMFEPERIQGERTEPIRQGDMVFVCDPALPRRKGIIEEVYHGVGGVIRRARVRVSDNGLSRIIMRPVSKLAVLDLSEADHGVGDVDGR
ncbi:uncharacterized protein LOC119561979 [Drosophila subpulchrella]|uniref:uncharacterized protein LOC119561979 n=1 Tax=Drosophila subpulchrella TaxID=1486046 RepID=UPI0018A147C2|nr:uncharacterized protein LOC119561979 [Drosophila subpulchrella]XP_037731298.1 uncharacterized protein LOC119561979 [Drosophila subpulchrella]XP_037731299.1 uncharacterized protein LOC119561979 [Drosophila subpulchrella]